MRDFYSWFEFFKNEYGDASVSIGNITINQKYLLDLLEDSFHKCWVDAYNVGKYSSKEEIDSLKEIIMEAL